MAPRKRSRFLYISRRRLPESPPAALSRRFRLRRRGRLGTHIRMTGLTGTDIVTRLRLRLRFRRGFGWLGTHIRTAWLTGTDIVTRLRLRLRFRRGQGHGSRRLRFSRLCRTNIRTARLIRTRRLWFSRLCRTGIRTTRLIRARRLGGECGSCKQEHGAGDCKH